jgi:GDPmannose 4,6-dehydratase
MTDKKALIIGVTGQDGSYLTELLLEKGYHVHGLKRRSSSFNTARVDHLYVDPRTPGVRFQMHFGDLTDATNLCRVVQEVQPDEIYNLGAQSHVQVSFETPEYTANTDALGTLRILEAMRILKLGADCRYYQASTSELFGGLGGNGAKGGHALPSAQPLCRGEALRLLDDSQLSRGLRVSRLERHPVQP